MSTNIDVATLKKDIAEIEKVVDIADKFVPGKTGETIRKYVKVAEVALEKEWVLEVLAAVVNAAENGLSKDELKNIVQSL